MYSSTFTQEYHHDRTLSIKLYPSPTLLSRHHSISSHIPPPPHTTSKTKTKNPVKTKHTWYQAQKTRVCSPYENKENTPSICMKTSIDKEGDETRKRYYKVEKELYIRGKLVSQKTFLKYRPRVNLVKVNATLARRMKLQNQWW
jgi:hypothetical protein